MKINLYMEGGTGDHLLANRFVPTIYEQFSDAEIHVFSDTENNFIQKTVLEHLYKSYYKSITVIPNKKWKKLIVSSQFNSEEIYNGCIDNVPDMIREKMEKNCDIFLNFHLDSLSFVEEKRFDFIKHFYIFPKPEISPPNLIGNYCISHLISSTSKEHRHEDFYITRLVKDIDKFCQELGWQHIIISQENFNQYYLEALKDCKVSQILNAPIIKVCDAIVNAKLMFSVDSGFRPIAYPLMPVISFSKQCSAPNQMQPSHILRWNPIKPYFPLNWNTNDIIKMARKLLENKAYQIFPELALTDQPIDNILIRRNYTINEEKSIVA